MIYYQKLFVLPQKRSYTNSILGLEGSMKILVLASCPYFKMTDNFSKYWRLAILGPKPQRQPLTSAIVFFHTRTVCIMKYGLCGSLVVDCRNWEQNHNYLNCHKYSLKLNVNVIKARKSYLVRCKQIFLIKVIAVTLTSWIQSANQVSKVNLCLPWGTSTFWTLKI